MTFIQKLQQLFKKSQEPQQTIFDLTRPEIAAPLRTPEVLNQIGKVYTEMQLQLHPKFGFAKNQDYNFSFVDISGFDFILKYYNTLKKHQMNVLLIGTGDNTFALRLKQTLNDKINITLLAPTDPPQKKEEEENIDITYVKANAEYLFTLFPANTFDIILSAQVFKSFVDPFGALIQMYQALIPGGIMLVDDFLLPGIQDQIPNIFIALNNKQYAIVADYIYGVQNNDVVIDGIRCLMVKKTLPQLEIPGIAYNGLHEDTKLSKSDYMAYIITPPFPSFTKHISVETEAFLNLVHSLIPDLSEEKIVQSILNPHILNSQLNSVENDAYTQALQTSFNHLMKTYNISPSEQTVQQGFSMITFIGRWIERIRNRTKFLMEIHERIGVNVTGKS